MDFAAQGKNQQPDQTAEAPNHKSLPLKCPDSVRNCPSRRFIITFAFNGFDFYIKDVGDIYHSFDISNQNSMLNNNKPHCKKKRFNYFCTYGEKIKRCIRDKPRSSQAQFKS